MEVKLKNSEKEIDLKIKKVINKLEEMICLNENKEDIKKQRKKLDKLLENYQEKLKWQKLIFFVKLFK